jgi:CHAT domain-containing protein
MIAQLLNRQFLLEQMESLTQQLSKDVRQERRGGRETEELEPADYREALDHLTKALEKERALSSGQPGYDVAADRRDGDRSAVLDDFSFFSRDPIVSIVQSALEYSYKQSDSRVQVVHQELSDDRFRGGDDYPAVTNLSLKDFQPRRGANNRRLFDRFSETDIGWAAAPQKVHLIDSSVVAPQYDDKAKVLKWAEKEKDLVLATFTGKAIMPASFPEVEKELETQLRSLVHFVCHGQEESGIQTIDLEDGKMSCNALLGMDGVAAAFAKKHPLVFLNACEVGRRTPALVGLGGFADSFIQIGASAVIAPLWSVEDEAAHDVASELRQEGAKHAIRRDLARYSREGLRDRREGYLCGLLLLRRPGCDPRVLAATIENLTR